MGGGSTKNRASSNPLALNEMFGDLDERRDDEWLSHCKLTCDLEAQLTKKTDTGQAHSSLIIPVDN